MGRRLDGWRALAWPDRGRLLACLVGLPILHASLAITGYARSRRIIEWITQRTSARTPNPMDIDDAQQLARLAAIAGRHGAVTASCLRQSLLLYGWLRLRGFQPALQLGIKPQQSAFQAHAWVELAGTRLLPMDEGRQAFRAQPQ